VKGITRQAKTEIAFMPKDDCCCTAMLSALVHTAGALSFGREGIGAEIISETPCVVSVAALLTKRLYGAECEFSHNQLSLKGGYVLEMLFDLGILTYEGEGVGAYPGISGFVVAEDCCLRSYLRGVFLGCGSLSIGKKYHLEMSFSTLVMAQDVIALLGSFDITAKVLARHEKHVVYIKGSESICDFLALIGASKAVLAISELVANRIASSQANRCTNCDLANADKTVATSMKQIECIKKVADYVTDPKLTTVMNVRLNMPESSYEELASELGVSKSTIKYRLKKLEKMENDMPKSTTEDK
jgi:DNA-binding protein WhiA